MIRFNRRAFASICAAALAVVLVVHEAEARAGGGGSRGSRSFSAPAATPTAPSAVSPLQRSATQPTSAVNRPAANAGGIFNRPGGMFGGGLLGGLAAGFIGAGLFGLLFGHGMLGGLGGFASILGLILQIGLVVIVARLAWAWWQRRQEPAMASGPAYRDAGNTGAPNGRGGLGGLGGLGLGGLGGAAANTRPGEPSDEIGIKPADYDTFERLLVGIQNAYSAEDLSALRERATPEMAGYFAEDLERNASHGSINRLSDVKLLQGDLSEAWREGNVEYATVAMRYSLVDSMVDRASGRVVEGDGRPQEVIEVWTFVRPRGSDWTLSAIQQA